MNTSPNFEPKFRIQLISEPDEHGGRDFIVEYEDRLITGTFSKEEIAEVFGEPIPAEDHSELEEELALAVAFEGIVPFDSEEFQGCNAFLEHIVAAQGLPSAFADCAPEMQRSAALNLAQRFTAA